MKAKSVTVSRLRVTKRFENERIEVTLDLEKGDTAAEAVRQGRIFIAEQFGEIPSAEELAEQRQILKEAQEALSQRGKEFQRGSW